MPDPIAIYLQPGESIGQALIRAGLAASPREGRHEVITIPPGVHIVGSGNLLLTRIIGRRTTGVPFLDC